LEGQPAGLSASVISSHLAGKVTGRRTAVKKAFEPLLRVFGRGVFPHQFAWLIDNSLRRVIIMPRTLADRISILPGATILELGPGSGYFSVELARRTPQGRLILLDLQPGMLYKARYKLASQGLTNASLVVCDANVAFPLRNNTVDIVVCVSVLGEVKDRMNCITAAFKVLRPGGILVVHESIPDPDLIRFEDLMSLVSRAGFQLRQRWGRWYNYTAAFVK
jgi:ubiquinone/menaquinone biosynthesis C-methylase UbiE